MAKRFPASWQRPFLTVMLILSIACTGCLGVVAGLGAAGAAGYVYYRGKVCHDYPADFQTSWNAVRATLADLRFPIARELAGANQGTIESQTVDGSKVSVDVEVIPSRIPAEPTVTRVCVRVGLVGDQKLSRRILDEVSYRLAQRTVPVLSPAPPASPIAPGTVNPPRPIPVPADPSTGRAESAEPPRPKLGEKSPSWSSPRR